MLNEVEAFWQTRGVGLGHIPESNSMYVVAKSRFEGEDKPARVIVALVDVAVNLYHTSFVGVVAPAQMAFGELVLVAPCKSPETGEQGVDGVRGTALLQASFAACEKIIPGKQTINKAIIKTRREKLNLIVWGLAFYGFGLLTISTNCKNTYVIVENIK